MEADKMFDKLGFNKKENKSEISYNICNSDSCYINSICFEKEKKLVYIYSECGDGDCETIFLLSKEILKAINKKLKELGW